MELPWWLFMVALAWETTLTIFLFSRNAFNGCILVFRHYIIVVGKSSNLHKFLKISPSPLNPFIAGNLVIWSKNAPKTWHFIYTPGPMVVISSRWDNGHPSKYSQKFGGIPREPGWIINVEYDADSAKYYNPPLSLLLNKKRLQKEIHQKWLALMR